MRAIGPHYVNGYLAGLRFAIELAKAQAEEQRKERDKARKENILPKDGLPDGVTSLANAYGDCAYALSCLASELEKETQSC